MRGALAALTVHSVVVSVALGLLRPLVLAERPIRTAFGCRRNDPSRPHGEARHRSERTDQHRRRYHRAPDIAARTGTLLKGSMR